MRLSAVFSLVFLFAVVVSAQSSPKFVSPYGNFEIALPPTPNLVRGVRNTDWPDKGVGMIYAWEVDNIVFTVLYLDPLDDAANDPAALLEDNNRNVRETAKRYGGAVQIENDVRLGEFPGRQLVAQIGAGKMITRNFQVGRRSYSLQAIARDPQNSARAFAVFGTFKIVDGRAVIASKFAALTPASLPRRPVPKSVRSDLAAAGVKGKVAKIVEESENLSAGGAQEGRRLVAEYFYDAKGLLTRENICDSRGLPARVSLYGFVGGELAVSIATDGTKKTSRFDYFISTTYDNAGRVTEVRYLDPKHVLLSKTTYEYAENSYVSKTYATGADQVPAVAIKLDERGNVVESSVDGESVVFRYDAYDKLGNWTRRTTIERRVEGGKTVDTPQLVTYREFVMY